MLEIGEIFKTIQKYYGLFMNKCDENSVILSGAKDPLKAYTNNAILRGLNYYSPQNDRKNICRFTRGEVHNKNRKAAFTLAEVLITLGIIGVVAALTLPTLIQNHQKQVYVTQLKKAYSTINNAMNKMAADEGVVDWSQTCFGNYVSMENENECFERLTKQLNILNSKKRGENCNADWCRSSIDEWATLSSFILITQDGAQYIFECGMPNLVVDVNGPTKGPNLEGRDIFKFNVRTDNNKIEPYGATHWNSDAWKGCSAKNLSVNCTAKVLIEGKMNY